MHVLGFFLAGRDSVGKSQRGCNLGRVSICGYGKGKSGRGRSTKKWEVQQQRGHKGSRWADQKDEKQTVR